MSEEGPHSSLQLGTCALPHFGQPLAIISSVKRLLLRICYNLASLTLQLSLASNGRVPVVGLALSYTNFFDKRLVEVLENRIYFLSRWCFWLQVPCHRVFAKNCSGILKKVEDLHLVLHIGDPAFKISIPGSFQ